MTKLEEWRKILDYSQPIIYRTDNRGFAKISSNVRVKVREAYYESK